VYKPSINELTFKPRDGKFTSKFKQIQLVFHGFGNLGSIVKFDGKPRRIEMLAMNFQHAAEKPAEGHPSTITCPTIVFPNQDGEILISW
jgi:hypothetical protein